MAKNLEQISKEEAKNLVDILGPHIKYDMTYDPVYCENREDVCGVRRLAENGSDYGYDTIYLLYKTPKGLNHEKVIDSQRSKDYIHIDSLTQIGDTLTLKVHSGGSYSGQAWNKTFNYALARLGLS